jgi:hypothetical protein
MVLPKRILIPTAAVLVVGAGIAGVGIVSAATNNQPGTLAQKLATTFHLDANKVQGVIDQDHADHRAQMEQRYEERLTQAVKDGELTESQKSAVLTEHKKLLSELEASKDSFKDKSPEERHDAMESIHTEAQNWAKDNSIDAKWLLGPSLAGPGRMHPMHGALGEPGI